MDGITVCRKLRREADKQVPLIMLTGMETLYEKLLGFESSVGDYPFKPFTLKEPEARTTKSPGARSLLRPEPCREIVRAHKGEIHFVAASDNLNTFSVSLPCLS